MAVREKSAWVRMRDGTQLATTIWQPACGAPSPTLIYRTPYGRRSYHEDTLGLEPEVLAEAGYVFVAQDVRGRGDSGGSFHFLAQEGADGQDTVAWVRRQPWSDGLIGTVGASYPGRVQLLLPPTAGVTAMAPAMAGLRSQDTWWPSGLLDVLVAAGWIRELAPRGLRQVDRENWRVVDWLLERGGQREVAAASLHPEHPLRQTIPAILPYLDRKSSGEDAEPPKVPTLHVTGWFDLVLSPTADAWQRAASSGRRHHHVIVGPWTHSDLSGTVADRRFPGGSASAWGLASRQQAFFDHYVRGSGPKPPQAEIYVTGANRWRKFAAWPPPTSQLRATTTVATPLVLRSQARFPFDLRTPTQSVMFESEPLASTVEIAGWPSVSFTLFARATVGLHLDLSEVDLKGSRSVISTGLVCLRAGSQRRSVELSPTHHVFSAGQRLTLGFSLVDPARHMLPDADKQDLGSAVFADPLEAAISVEVPVVDAGRRAEP